MFRQLLRHGIRAVQDGRTPESLCREADRIIGTYANDTVVRVRLAATAEQDRQLMRATPVSFSSPVKSLFSDSA
jgi:hypothetical protein